VTLQEFERDFPPRSDFPRGPRWNDDEARRFPEFPEDEERFGRRRREEREFPDRGEDRFFRDREFGRPRNFDDDRRFPDDRRPPLDWERDVSMHPAFRSFFGFYPFVFSAIYTSLYFVIVICQKF